jgi:uncharacterized membrane protein YgcG
MTHRLHCFVFFTGCLALCAPVAAQANERPAGEAASRRPLNLSLPREAVLPPNVLPGTDPQLEKNLRKQAPTVDESGNPDRGMFDSMSRPAVQAPYGTGFEARQRGMDTPGGFGGSAGGGFGGRSGGGAAGGGRGR